MKNKVTLAQLDTRTRIFSIISSASGNLVEWYDFYIYSFTSIYFASQFFPSDGDVITQLLKAAGVFFIGFLMRPIGGWLFGWISDRYGRKSSMLISIYMMCAGSFFISILPTYETIGSAAAFLLILLRMIQGLSVGGEYGTTATYMSEVALKNHRGFFGSFQYTTLIAGQLLASLVVFALSLCLTDEQLRMWGWRIPFVIGGLAAIVAIYLRRSLHETSTETSRSQNQAGSLLELFRNHRKAFLLIMCITAGGSLTFYTFTTYMQKYLITTTGLDKRTATTIMTGALFVFMIVQPMFGLLADKIGTKSSLLIWSTLFIIFTIPGLIVIGNTTNPWIAGSAIVGMLCIASTYTSISGVIKADMFPASVRTIGVGFPYALANALFGGSAEYVALGLKNIGYEFLFYFYIVSVMTMTFIAVILIPDPRKTGYLQQEDAS